MNIHNKITFFIASYSLSGVPLAQIRLAKALQRRGHIVDFVIGYVPENLSMPEIQGIRVLNLNIPRTYKLLLPIISHIRANEPDLIFTAEDHLNVIVTIAAVITRSNAKISASSRITPYRVYSDKLFTKAWVLKKTSLLLQKRVNALICVSKDMVKEYEEILGNSRYQCIYNIIMDADTLPRMIAPLNDPWFIDNSIPIVISAGTLTKRKGFIDLINAMKLVIQSKAARLVILGEGYLRADLEAIIKRDGLADSVRLLGFKDNPLKYFSRSKVFVLSSYAEGMPNVLVEAMMCGCTPVATDCPTGPRELLQDGRYGYLVPMRDPQAMAVAIVRALDNPISQTLLDEALVPFEENRVIDRHFEVLGICEK